MIELRDLLLQLRKGESIKGIHRSSGRHKTIIRTLKALAEHEGWLAATACVPSEAEIQTAWNTRLVDPHTKAHPLDLLLEDFTHWRAEGTSIVVMHKLACASVPCSEATVRRYLHRTFPELPSSVVPRVHEPGKVMDVDFGYLGLVDDEAEEKTRKAWVFSARLRYSRKAFRKIVLSQDQSTFFACHVEAFEFLGGVPRQVTPDNLKAAVIKASWNDPLVNRAYRNLAEHYGFSISPCLPATPEHKGGVENDMKYVKRNYWPLLKDRERHLGNEVPRFKEAARYLVEWNDTVSETRLIARVGRTVPELFALEAPALLPLPATRWDPMNCAMAKVGVDWRIQFQKAFYSVPYKYIGEQVLVTATRQTVRIYHNNAQVALHSRATRAWQSQILLEHGPPEAEAYLATCSKGLVQVAYGMGMHVGLMAQAILEDRAVDGIRPLRALVGLKNRYPVHEIDQVCARLLSYGLIGFTGVKNELKHAQELASASLPSFRFARQAAYYEEVLHG